MRPWRTGDARPLAALCNDEEAARWLPLRVPFTVVDGREWIATAAGKWRNEKYAAFAVDDVHTGELIGSVSVRVDTQRQLGDIGYLVKREARRRGSASRAVSMLVDWCFDDLGLGRVQIRCEPGNVASRAVAEACGFVFEGVLRAENVVRDRRVDSAIFSLLPSDRERQRNGPSGGSA